MERFEGNGAECMVRFIAEGCKGEIRYAEATGNGDEDIIMTPVYWKESASNVDQEWGIAWLAKPCVYTTPEPVWRDATNREALLAYLIDKGEVEYQITEYAPIEMDRAWHKVTTDYTAWTDPYRRYRIREDA